MNDIEIIDKFINHLYANGAKTGCIREVVVADKAQTGRVETMLVGEDLAEEKASTVATRKYFKISSFGIKTIINYGSYSSYLKEEDEKRKLEAEILDLQSDNLKLQNKQLKRGLILFCIGVLTGFITTNFTIIVEFMRKLLSM